ncbi:MAG TPA: 6-bladed beta-propeller [Gemmatimonadales bacterium]|nr:6-bladed beta-propeller [Gemmatimonadales bacterium]
MPLPRLGAALLLLVACSGGGDVPGFTRETGPDGREIVSYAAGLPAGEDTLIPLFTIGKYVDDSSEIFGHLFDVDVSPDRRIYALDVRPTEVMVFDSAGKRIGTVGRRGEGPGEFSRTNGIHLGPDGTLWVNDNGKRMVLAIDPDGTERVRVPELTTRTGLAWDVVIDTAGVLWELKNRQVSGGSTMGINGLHERELDRQFFSLDPASGARDSIAVGPWTAREYGVSFNQGNNQILTELPFRGPELAVMDRHRRIWVARSDDYTLFRLDIAGDTTLSLNIVEAGLPILPGELAAWKERWAGLEPEAPGITAGMMDHMPATKALVMQLFVDDHERLWVRRVVDQKQSARWDVFAPDGAFLATLRGPVEASEALPAVVRGNRIHVPTNGDAGERYIVVAELPERLRVSR